MKRLFKKTPSLFNLFSYHSTHQCIHVRGDISGFSTVDEVNTEKKKKALPFAASPSSYFGVKNFCLLNNGNFKCPTFET